MNFCISPVFNVHGDVEKLESWSYQMVEKFCRSMHLACVARWLYCGYLQIIVIFNTMLALSWLNFSAVANASAFLCRQKLELFEELSAIFSEANNLQTWRDILNKVIKFSLIWSYRKQYVAYVGCSNVMHAVKTWRQNETFHVQVSTVQRNTVSIQ